LTTLELAERVGPEGRVVGIDGSEEFIDILRRKAEGISHIEVVQADVRNLDLPAESADAYQRTYLPELVKRGLLQEDERQAHLNEWREREQDPQACRIAPAMVGVIGAKF
jgi:ubiquinone/menaquinone biosynthesis C-methylase UbiE